VEHTLIVPVHNGSEFIHLFWHSLLPNTLDRSEIIVVDDGSREDIQRLVPRLPATLKPRFLRNDQAQGYAKAVNLALACARGEYIYLLNTDLILGHGALALLYKYLRSDSRIGVVGAKLLYPQTGKIQHFGLAFSPTRKFHIFTHMDPDHPLVSLPREFQAVTFALCGLRRSLITEIGCLDGRYCNGCEDIDFCLLAKEHGYRNLVPSEVVSYHWESLSGDGARHVATHENEARFWSKWSGKIRVDIGSFVGQSLSFFLNAYPQLSALDFTVVNFSPGGDFAHVIAAMEPLFARYGDFSIWDYSRVSRNNGQIWLAMALPFDAIRAPRPFIFVVPEYPLLFGNHYWFTSRRRFCSHDVIVDHYGNVMLAAEPVFWANAARQKGPMDAS
jgi:GT2 family glycosyltransferase